MEECEREGKKIGTDGGEAQEEEKQTKNQKKKRRKQRERRIMTYGEEANQDNVKLGEGEGKVEVEERMVEEEIIN